MKLPQSFFLQEDVVSIARALLGKILISSHNEILTGGIITETEAYAGVNDKASHAFGGRRTKRNEAMYLQGGIAYVYLCYGIHNLLNIVTNHKEIPHAVLIRSIKPLIGMQTMQERRKKEKNLGTGPGVLTQALGITLRHNQMPFSGSDLWIEEGERPPSSQILSTPRIGVAYAKEDALLPYRFLLTEVVK